MSSKAFRKEDIEGKTVIETSGKVGGKVKDVTFSLDGAITFIVVKDDGTERPISLKQVVGISDHVIVRGDGAHDLSWDDDERGSGLQVLWFRTIAYLDMVSPLRQVASVEPKG